MHKDVHGLLNAYRSCGGKGECCNIDGRKYECFIPGLVFEEFFTSLSVSILHIVKW
jgi:hypothetical protein